MDSFPHIILQTQYAEDIIQKMFKIQYNVQ